MTREDLIEKLSKYGEVQMCKDGYVLTVLITGKKLDSLKSYGEIGMLVSDFAKEKYPYVECIRNSFDYLLMVLKP